MGSYKECTWRDDGSLYLDYPGYIDHSYEAYDFAKALLDNDEMLLAYLLDSDSCVATGNDNSEFNCAQGCWVYPWSHLNSVVDNGDLFKVGFSKWGKVRENDPAYYPWTWRFLAVPGDYAASEQTD